jgi:hypothetical protein
LSKERADLLPAVVIPVVADIGEGTMNGSELN